MKERLSEEAIAMRASLELKPGDYCNLGAGLPALCATYAPEGVYFQAENGIIGYGPLITEDNWEQADYGHVDALGHFVLPNTGESYFDFLTSFIMIRSGRLYTILGALEVSEKGDLANHSLGKNDEYLMIGGAMDLAWGAKKVIVTMPHNTKEGRPKIVKNLNLPLTSKGSVKLIVTDLAVIEVTDKGLVLNETAPGWTAGEIQALTEPTLAISPDVKEIEL
jgi:3-oxoacid CoA-transferase B subunit